MDYIFRQAKDEDLERILELQSLNLKSNLTDTQKEKEGFVTVLHSYDDLKVMNDANPHTVVIHNGKLVGYALTMVPKFRNLIPILIPMFEMIDEELSKANREDSYVIMGQVCIAEGHRGKGLFKQLYKAMKNYLSNQFDINITEVATSNIRSMRAHKNVGYEIMKIYSDSSGTEWALIEWNWKGV